MNMKKLLIAFVALALVVPATFVAAQSQQVVEGHTTYAQLNNVQNANFRGNATAVAVYVTNSSSSAVANDVLWFDDTFLYNAANQTSSYDCVGGAVWAVPSGQGQPVDPNNVPLGVLVQEQEWYQITTEQGQTFAVVKYQVSPVNNDTVNSFIPFNEWGVQVMGGGAPGTSGCAATQTVTRHADGICPALDANATTFDINYNAVLFFFTSDLGAPTGAKSYGTGGLDTADNTTQGNSHPYNDAYADYGPTHTHNTYSVDLYWEGYVPATSGAPLFSTQDTGVYHPHTTAC